tara:strand:- start:3811 stop:4311 length:501 start_codon:yes stop_codon:yes gene_type:complete
MKNRYKVNYHKYIDSEEWRSKRTEFMNSMPRRSMCFICGTSSYLHVHHMTYRNLGSEIFNDLLTLCRNHHRELHKFADKKKIDIWKATMLYCKSELGYSPKSRKAKRDLQKRVVSVTPVKYAHKIKLTTEQVQYIRDLLIEYGDVSADSILKRLEGMLKHKNKEKY